MEIEICKGQNVRYAARVKRDLVYPEDSRSKALVVPRFDAGVGGGIMK